MGIVVSTYVTHRGVHKNAMVVYNGLHNNGVAFFPVDVGCCILVRRPNVDMAAVIGTYALWKPNGQESPHNLTKGEI